MYQLTDLPPLESRTIIHSSQIRDNGEDEGQHKLLLGKKNTFHVHFHNGHIYVSRPFEEEISEPLDKMVDYLRNEGDEIHFRGFPEHSLEDFKFKLIPGDSYSPDYLLWQHPKDEEDYNRRLKKFKNAGFTYQPLNKEHVPDLIELIRNWAETKKKIALNYTRSTSFQDARDLSDEIRTLCIIDNEVKRLGFTVKDKKFYQKKMDQPLTQFHGVFQDGILLAYLRTEGNSSFQSFHSRASVRRNSFSPQEYLDLVVAIDFVNQGVPIFDRGYIIIRAGIIGLLEYKKKFGNLSLRRECDWNRMTLLDAPEHKYLQRLMPQNSD